MYQASFGLVLSPLLPTLSARPKSDAPPPCCCVCFSSQSWTAKQTFKLLAAKLCQRLQARPPLVPCPPPAPSCALMWTCCFATLNHLVRNTLGPFFFVGRWFVWTCNLFLISQNIKYVSDCLRVLNESLSFYLLECSIPVALTKSCQRKQKILCIDPPNHQLFQHLRTTWCLFFFCHGDMVVLDLTQWGVCRLQCVQLYKVSYIFMSMTMPGTS